MIRRFENEHAFLNPFYTLYVSYQGGLYPSVGHAYAAAHTDDQRKRMRIATAVSAREVLSLQKGLPALDEKHMLDIMCELLKQKFTIPALRKQLQDTGTQELIYGNSPDAFWGIDEATGMGANHLGVLLMEIRGHI